MSRSWFGGVCVVLCESAQPATRREGLAEPLPAAAFLDETHSLLAEGRSVRASLGAIPLAKRTPRSLAQGERLGLSGSHPRVFGSRPS